MGSPTPEHESRVDELRTLATLAGFTVDVRLPWRLRPDVARLSARTLRLLVGDAKHTEDPDCDATLHRLRWYTTALAGVPARATTVTLALAVPAEGDARGWARLLVSAVAGCMVCSPPQWTDLGGTIIVAVRACQARSGRGHAYRDRPWPTGTDNGLSAPSTCSAARAA
jgi:hypothetical protein